MFKANDALKEFLREFWGWANVLSTFVTFASLALSFSPEFRTWLPEMWILQSPALWIALYTVAVFIIAINTTKRVLNVYEKDKVEFRTNFLLRNPDLYQYEKVFRLYRLSAEAKFYASQGGELPRSKHQDWNERVELLLQEICDRYLIYYKLNLADGSPFNERVCKLEQTLEYIVWGDASNKPEHFRMEQ